MSTGKTTITRDMMKLELAVGAYLCTNLWYTTRMNISGCLHTLFLLYVRSVITNRKCNNNTVIYTAIQPNTGKQ